MSKQIKQMEMDVLKNTFKDVRDMVVLSVKGVNAIVDNTVRHSLRKKNIRVKVVKNSLTRRVFGELGFGVKEDSPYWVGTTVIAWGAGSLGELSKAIDAEFKGKQGPALKDKLTVKGAISDGTPIPFELAVKMPTRAEAIANVIGLALAPAARLLSQITGPAASVASQIKSISEKTGEPAPTANAS
jgi:large subunit ribosomal protein L10